ncbi:MULTISPECIES: hypothetical protein [Gammaproteobacteria]|uniref:hypothetical protein n=1 Tax=Gammaproteobacteria TaxID=1236 RepID=UPI001ADBC213|nr:MULTISPECIES: hypothetical protein [Gammaproteobacteria]MBO9481811.1 hypothetical protein [Salinisphaera sp. G21_0]MBO9495060.1 hypothetical protein [Thalassotalea sp. G20_0]
MQPLFLRYNNPTNPPDSLPLFEQSEKILIKAVDSFLGGVIASTASLDIHRYFNGPAEDYARQNLVGYEKFKYDGLQNGEIKVVKLFVYPLILFVAQGGLADCSTLAKSIYDRVCSRLASHS